MVAPLQIGPGIDIGGGIFIGNFGSFTLTSADFTNSASGGGITPNGTSGFSSDGLQPAGRALYSAYDFTPSFQSILTTFYADNSLATDYTGYIYSVSWAAGSTPGSTIAILGTDGTSQLLISPVSTANNDWQTPGTDPYALQSAAGTYNFPATFTLYQPVIHDLNNWC